MSMCCGGQNNARAWIGLAFASLIVASLMLFGLLPQHAVAQPGDRVPADRGSGGGGRGAEGGPINVERLMKDMNRSLRSLGESIADAARKDDNVKLINELQRGCVTSKLAGAPASILARAASDADKSKLTDAYRADLIAATRKLLHVEELVAAGKNHEASKALDEFVKLRDQAHKNIGLD